MNSTANRCQGKTWLACALGQQACREGYTALYLRLPSLLQDLPMAKGDGRYGKVMASLAKADGLLLDDWRLAVLSDEHRRDVLEILEDRHDRRSTRVTSQFPVDHWHEAIGNLTLADAILDRLVHNAYKNHSPRRINAETTRPLDKEHRVFIISSNQASLRSDGVAAFVWNGWQPSHRNRWQLSAGLRGNFALD